MLDKKGEVSRMFSYMMIGIIVVVILAVGLFAVSRISEQGKFAKQAALSQEIKKDVSLALVQGSMQQHTYELPVESPRLCIIDDNHKLYLESSPSFQAISPYMYDALATDSNVFFLDADGKIKNSQRIENLAIDYYPYYKCYDETAAITFQGKAGKASVFIETSVSQDVECTTTSEVRMQNLLGITIVIPSATTITPADGSACSNSMLLEIATQAPDSLPSFGGISFDTEVFSLSPSLTFSQPVKVLMKYIHDPSTAVWPVVTLSGTQDDIYYYILDPEKPVGWSDDFAYTYDSLNQEIEFYITHFSHIFAGTSEIRDV
ncbi:MAG: hypothetical protein V1659_02735 [Candidatus Woesearchaeota archaeon]